MVSSEENIQNQQKDYPQNLEIMANIDSASEKSNQKYSESDTSHRDDNDENHQGEEVIQNHYKVEYNEHAAVLDLKDDKSEPPEPLQQSKKDVTKGIVAWLVAIKLKNWSKLSIEVVITLL